MELDNSSGLNEDVKNKLLHILKCFVGETPIDQSLYLDTLPELYSMAEIHCLQPILYYMMAPAADRIKDRYPQLFVKMQKQYRGIVYHSLRQEMDMQEMASEFKRGGIKLAFFKGVEIQTFYPEPKLRTMGDLDCVISERDRKEAYDLMLGLGYVCSKDKGDVWVYQRKHTIVEMHTRIASNSILNKFDYETYFQDALAHVVKKNGAAYLEPEYHFCFLLYHIAKHLSSTGAGIRMILDIALLIRNGGSEIDWDKLKEMLCETQLDRLAGAVFRLCEKWFGIPAPLSGENADDKLLADLEEYIVAGGVFGFETHGMGDVYLRKAYAAVPGKGRLRYRMKLFINFIFRPADDLKHIFPLAAKYKCLLPIAWIKRGWIGVFRHRRKSMNTIHTMMQDDSGRSEREYKMLKELGL